MASCSGTSKKKIHLCVCVQTDFARKHYYFPFCIFFFFYSACLYKRTQLKPKASKSLSTAPSHALKAPSRNMPAIKTKGQGKEKKNEASQFFFVSSAVNLNRNKPSSFFFLLSFNVVMFYRGSFQPSHWTRNGFMASPLATPCV